MASRSPSTPSEGEIVESDSEKATTSLPSANGTNVDRHSRKRPSVSPSPSPYRSPRRYRSRSRSRSPYRERRGTKRPRDEDHYSDRNRSDPRQFKVHYEGRARDDQRKLSRSYRDLDRDEAANPRLRYEDRHSTGHSRDRRPRTRSRSPVVDSRRRQETDRLVDRRKDTRLDERARRDRNDHGYAESSGRLSREQSVSDRGLAPVATARTNLEAETQKNQKQQSSNSVAADSRTAANNIQHTSHVAGDGAGGPSEEPVKDEATLIESRRKRREAIKAKYNSQAAPLLVQALASGKESPLRTLKFDESASEQQSRDAPNLSPPQTPKDGNGQESPTAFTVVNDEDLANDNVQAEGDVPDEPSAADYDPRMDMEEDKMRHDQRHQGDELPSGAYDETKTANPDVLLPDPVTEKPKAKKPKDEFDMFADEDEEDMFAEVPTEPAYNSMDEGTRAAPVPQAKALDMSMLDDWDDHEGYYKIILGELLDGRYHVHSNLGKGMFSGVVRAMDQKTKRLVAIKLIRNNETMKKAGLKEIEILQKIAHYDPEDKKHLIRLERFFEHKGHLCMVFENLSINLREVLKKFGRDVGINLKAVRAYAQQMFLGLSLLRKCNILHADLKPDNMLVNESRNILKVCDLGSASDASENEITQYLVSRFYRAPEIILGMPYDFAIDTWSIGCTLFELYTGKILFTGRTNNQMLRSIMECRGKLSHKILRRAQFAGMHFDDLLNFRSVEKDKLTGKDVVRILNFTKPTRDLRTRLVANAKGLADADMKELALFLDLLERCLTLNPEKRCTPSEALKHPFIMRARS